MYGSFDSQIHVEDLYDAEEAMFEEAMFEEGILNENEQIDIEVPRDSYFLHYWRRNPYED